MPNLVGPDQQFREYFREYRAKRTVNPIPFDKSMAQKPQEETPVGQLHSKKITVVGMGQVGLACVSSILNQDICGTLAMVDVGTKKLMGDAKDFQQGSAFHQHTTVLAGDSYDVSADSNLVVITAGVPQKPGESRLSLVERNVAIMKMIMPQVLEFSPDATILIVSNPCDIMTAVAVKLAGAEMPQGKIFGAGTCLDSSRFRSLIAQSMDLDPKNVHGYILGEHGDSSIPVWSSVRIGCLPLLDPGEEPDETLMKLHKAVVSSAYDIINLKGYTNWAIGMSTAHICKCVLNDSRSIIPLSTCVRGLYGVEEDVFLSVPCSVSTEGVQRVAVLPLTDAERATFKKSADSIWEVQKSVWDAIVEGEASPTKGKTVHGALAEP